MAALVVLLTVQKRVAMLLEANPDDGSYAAANAADQQKYHPDEITQAALEIDLEVCQAILDTPDHGDRNIYLTNSADLSNGDQIPAHPGRTGTVEIKLADSTYKSGILTRNMDALRKLIMNPDSMYGAATDMEGRYGISEEGKIYFVGSKARIQLALNLENTGVCQAPLKYTTTVIRGTIGALRKPNELEAGLFTFYQSGYERDLNLIRSKAAAIPPLESYKKAGG